MKIPFLSMYRECSSLSQMGFITVSSAGWGEATFPHSKVIHCYPHFKECIVWFPGFAARLRWLLVWKHPLGGGSTSTLTVGDFLPAVHRQRGTGSQLHQLLEFAGQDAAVRQRPPFDG